MTSTHDWISTNFINKPYKPITCTFHNQYYILFMPLRLINVKISPFLTIPYHSLNHHWVLKHEHEGGKPSLN